MFDTEMYEQNKKNGKYFALYPHQFIVYLLDSYPFIRKDLNCCDTSKNVTRKLLFPFLTFDDGITINIGLDKIGETRYRPYISADAFNASGKPQSLPATLIDKYYLSPPIEFGDIHYSVHFEHMLDGLSSFGYQLKERLQPLPDLVKFIEDTEKSLTQRVERIKPLLYFTDYLLNEFPVYHIETREGWLHFYIPTVFSLDPSVDVDTLAGNKLVKVSIGEGGYLANPYLSSVKVSTIYYPISNSYRQSGLLDEKYNHENERTTAIVESTIPFLMMEGCCVYDVVRSYALIRQTIEYYRHYQVEPQLSEAVRKVPTIMDDYANDAINEMRSRQTDYMLGLLRENFMAK